MTEKDKDNKRISDSNSLHGGVLIGLLVLFAIAVLWGYESIAKIRKDISALNVDVDAMLKDSTAFMRPADVRIMVYRSTQEAFDTYVSTQDNLLAIIAFFITVIVVVIPLILNNNFRASNKEWFRGKVKQYNKEIKDQINTANGNLVEMNKTMLENTKNELNVKIIQAKEQIDDRIAIINGNLLGLSNLVKQIEKDYDQILINSHHENEYGRKVEKIINEGESRNVKITKLEKFIQDNRGKMPASGFYSLGALYFEEKDYEKAIDNFESAIISNPYHVEAFRSLAVVNLEKCNLKDAWKNIEKAIDLQDDDYCLFDIRRQVFFKMNAFKDAKKDAEKCVELAINKDYKEKSEDDLKKINKIIEEEKGSDLLEISLDDITIKMIKVHKGAFTMGATDDWDQESYYDEKPAHRVLLNTYYIGSTVVTQALWERIMGNNPSYFNGDGELPVESITYKDVKVFLEKLNENTLNSRPEDMEFRLPYEAEWEYAARGGNKSKNFKYSGSNTLKDVAWFGENKTHPVMRKKSNELGLYDMSGNVWEICEDFYNVYSSECQVNPKGPQHGDRHVCRGGSWNYSAGDCRVLNRGYLNDKGYYHIGFRLLLSPKQN